MPHSAARYRADSGGSGDGFAAWRSATFGAVARFRNRVAVVAVLIAVSAACSDDSEVVARSSSPVATTVGPAPAAPFPSTTAPAPAPAPTTTIAEALDTVPVDSAPEPPAGQSSTTLGDGPPEPGADGFGDPYYPTYGNGGYDVVSYDLAITWDPDAGRLDGVATITAVALDNLSSFNLDLSVLTVSEVEVDGEPATHQSAGLELTIDPATDLVSGEEFVAEVTYGGIPEPQQGTVGIPGGWFRDRNRGVMVFGEPEGAASWYPVNDHPKDKALYRISVTAPSDLTVASNGIERTKTMNGATTTWTYAHESPISSYLTTVVIGDYVIVDGGTSTNGTPIRNVFPTAQVDRLTETFGQQPQMIDALEEWFGPYPFEVYGSAVANGIPFGGALEVQTLSLFDPAAAVPEIIVHELAHQWFGDSVGLTRWQDIWLNEGFASYAEQLWAESLDPTYDITAAYELYALRIGADLDTPPGDPGPDNLFGASVYIRGAMTLHALRLAIGDDDFRTVLTRWASERRDQSGSTEQFIALAEDVADQDLSALFDEWLYQPQLPDTLGDVPLGN
jgi:aminopeptidase N